jgi:hypothetical protein
LRGPRDGPAREQLAQSRAVALDVAADRLEQDLGLDTVKRRQVRVQHDALSSDQMDCLFDGRYGSWLHRLRHGASSFQRRTIDLSETMRQEADDAQKKKEASAQLASHMSDDLHLNE